MFILRTFMLLALVVWLGGIIFFAFVVAPTAFTVLPTTTLAGDVVRRSLTALHWMGIVAAAVFLICSLAFNRAKSARLKAFALVNVLVVIMLVLTLISQFGITPEIRALRAELHAADSLQGSDAGNEFNRMHQWSTRLEGGVLFLGVAVVVLTARRFS
ncbi:MAG TPA: DUF4149 domain-containing protein [Candidatus Angelobacter sp.]